MDDTLRNSADRRDAAAHDASNNSAAPRDRESAGPGCAGKHYGWTWQCGKLLVLVPGCEEHLVPLVDGYCPQCRDVVLPDPATAPATRLPEPGPDAEPAVICAWCPSLHVLKLQRREQDVVIIYWQGKELRIIRNGVNLKVSHAICQPCRERLHTDRRTASQDTTL